MNHEKQNRVFDQNEGGMRERLIALASDRPQIYTTAQEWFIEQGEKMVPALVRELDEEYLGSVCQLHILLLLRVFALEETIPAILNALHTALRSHNYIVIPGAMEALATFHTPDAVRAIIDLTCDSDSDIVKHAATLLGKIGDPKGIEPLLRLLGNDDAFIRYSAARALVHMNAPAVRATLERCLETETDSEIRELLFSAGIGNPRIAPEVDKQREKKP